MENVKRITPEKFDAMLERIMSNGKPIANWYPTMDDVAEISRNPVKYYEFLLWILESNPDQELTEDQIEVEKQLQKIFKQCTQFG